MSTSNQVDPAKLDLLIQRLFETREEIESFMHELPAGDAGGLKVFKKLKEDFKNKIDELSALLPADESGDAARLALAELGETFAVTPPADATNYFMQKQNILVALNKVEKHGLHLDTHSLDLHHEIEKLKLKLEIVMLMLTVSKFVVSAAFQKEFRRAFDRVNTLRETVLEKMSAGKKNALTLLRGESKKIYSAAKRSLKHIGK